MLKQFSLIISFVLLSLCFSAQAFQAPALSGPVIDEVGLLSGQTINTLSQSIRQFQQTNSAQIQIYIAKSLNDEVIESVAIQLFDQWKLGDQKKDDGILLIIAPNERKLRIEVGQGLEGAIPDAIAKRIIAEVMTPYFKRGEFDLGVMQGLLAIQKYTLADPEQTAAEVKQRSQGKKPYSNYVIFIVIGLWLILFMISPGTAIALLLSAGRGGRGGGYGGGGGWSGGGGSSSGGGSSGGW